MIIRCLAALSLLLASSAPAAPLSGTKALTMTGDMSENMVAGISLFLDRETAMAQRIRGRYWNRDFSSAENYDKSIAPNRAKFRKIVGVVDERLPLESLQYVATTSSSGVAAESDQFKIYAVRWPVMEGVYAEGLLVQPRGRIRAHIIAIPDADQTPEQLVGLAPGIPLENQYARWLAQTGVQVVIPTLISRSDEHSGNKRLNRWTNQPHREWIYRQAFEMGRHVIGYEIQRVLSVVDWFENVQKRTDGEERPIGVIGFNEGGLVALYAAACDTRIDSTCVSGYFQSRQKLWSEPIYRNVWSLLRDFGDAEIATMVSPRQLIIEHSKFPEISGPPKARKGRRGGAAPGTWKTPTFKNVNAEWMRTVELMLGAPAEFPKPVLVSQQDGKPSGPGSAAALIAFLNTLGIEANPFAEAPCKLTDIRTDIDPEKRQHRQMRQLEEHVQRLLLHAADERNKRFWNLIKPTTGEAWSKDTEKFRDEFRHDVIGWFPNKRLSLNPRSRKFKETDKWAGYEGGVGRLGRCLRLGIPAFA